MAERDELKQQIEEHRDAISETVNEIQDRVAPSNVAERMKFRAGQTVGRVRAAGANTPTDDAPGALLLMRGAVRQSPAVTGVAAFAVGWAIAKIG